MKKEKTISNTERERRRKISETLTGRKRTPETRAKISAALMGKKRPAIVIEKLRENALKQWADPANVEKARQNAIKQWEDPEKRQRGELANRMTAKMPGMKEKKSKIMTMLWQDKEHRAMMSKANKGKRVWNKGVPMTPEYKANMIKAVNKPEVLEVKRKKSKALWRDPEYIKKVQNGYHCKPNKPESMILDLLESLYPGEWKFTGDFSLIINGKSPDFVNCNGKKLIIELFGDYWHRGEDPKDRAKVFEPFGYDTLVIWESELKDIDAVGLRVKEFMLE